jgi:hypothetical protein
MGVSRDQSDQISDHPISPAIDSSWNSSSVDDKISPAIDSARSGTYSRDQGDQISDHPISRRD